MSASRGGRGVASRLALALASVLAALPTDARAETGTVGVADATSIHPAVRLMESKRATVVIFGDSLVTGLGLKDRTSRWTDQLQRALRRSSWTALFTIDNRGVAGQSIIAERPPQDRVEDFDGGRLVDHVRVVYPEGTPRESVAGIAIVVPSINEIIVSQLPTAQERVDFGVAGLRFVRTYLLAAGVRTVLITPMVPPTQAWDDSTNQDVLAEIDLFNASLATAGLLTPVDYGIDRDGLRGADPVFFDLPFFDGVDQLHPGIAGHAAIARGVATPLTDLAIRM